VNFFDLSFNADCERIPDGILILPPFQSCLYRPGWVLCASGPAKSYYDQKHWIRDLAVDISARCGKNKFDPAAWRVLARKWLEKHKLIIIRKPANVLPDFSSILCHN